MRGRKPTPTVLKILAGNPGKRPLPENEPAAPRGKPRCPDHLKGEAKKEWGRICRELESMGLLHVTDRAAIALYCQLYAQWVEAIEKIGTDVVIKMPNGWPAPNPYLPVANKAAAQMVKLLTEFGLTPSSRTRIHAQPAKADDAGADPFAELG